MPQSTLEPAPSSSSPDITPPSTPANSFHCYRCGYNLHGISKEGLCPECGEPAKSSISASDYLKNNTSRSFWVNLSLALVECTLIFEIALTALTFILLISGFQIQLNRITQWLPSYWLILITFASYTLFFGITRVNRKGPALFTRSVLLYLLAAMLVLCAFQHMFLHDDALKFKGTMNLFFRTFHLWLFFLLLTPLPVGFLLFGLWLTSTRSGARPAKRYFILTAALWLALCVLTIPTFYIPYNMVWKIMLPFTSSPAPLNRYYIYSVQSPTDQMREYNVYKLSPIYRCDPAPTLWGTLLAQAAHQAWNSHKYAAGKATSQHYAHQPYHGNQYTSSLGSAQLVTFVLPASTPIPPGHSASAPSPAPTFEFLALESLWLLLGFALSIWFTIQLFLLTRAARKSFNTIAWQL